MTYFRFQGSTLKVSDGTTATTVLTKIGGLLSCQHNPGSATDVDRTNADSTRKITKQGLLDSGTFECELQRDPEDLGQIELQDAKDGGLKRYFEWSIPNPSGGSIKLNFYGYVKVLSLNSETEGDAKGTCRIRITGAVIRS